MKRMPRRARILSNFHPSLAHRGCAMSSVALAVGSPLLVEGTVLGKLGGSSLQVLGGTHWLERLPTGGVAPLV